MENQGLPNHPQKNPHTVKSMPWISRGTALPNHYYFYLLDEDFGPLFIKFCSYFTYAMSFGDARMRVAALLDQDPAFCTPGRMTYDLRRLGLHGLIERKPRANRSGVTSAGKRIALFFVRAEARYSRVVLSLETQLNHNSAPDALLAASQAIDRLIQEANLAAVET